MSIPGSRLLELLRSGINTGLERTSGGPSPYLEPEEQASVDRQRRMAMAASLLRSAAPHPQGTGNFLGDLGTALGAGQKVEQGGLDDAFKARLLAAQMAASQQRGERNTVVPAGSTVLGADGKPIYTAPTIPKPVEMTDAAKKVTEIEAAIGRKLSDKERFTVMGAGELYKAPAAEELDKPLSATELARLRTPDGSSFPFGTTGKQASAAGAHSFSDAELTRQSNTTAAVNTLGELKTLALGEGGAFRDNGGSPLTNNVLARLANGISNGIGAFFGTEASMRRDVFNTTAQGSIASLVRSMGEAGSLSDGDVKRALSLIPALGAMPDTEATAKAKFEELQQIISRGTSGLGGTGNSQTVGKPKFLGFE